MKRHTTEIVGNFDLGECFAEVKCIHDHPTRPFNIGCGHFVACDACRTYVFVGSNLMSGWRQENEAVWRRNHESVEGHMMLE
jgi:ferredoxin